MPFLVSCRIVVVLSALGAILLCLPAIAEDKDVPIGSLKGRVTSARTQQPLVGATVMLVGTERGTSTDSNGEYSISSVTVGSYSLSFRSVGFEPVFRADVMIRSERTTFVNAALEPAAHQLEDIRVTGNYFNKHHSRPAGWIDYTGEEVRRSPGTGGDVSRIVMVQPSIAKLNDQFNSLVVRGGNPIENGFYLDNIEIPNINHYPIQGTSGGSIGLINVDFITDVSFSAGGFSAAYGDRLSSVMDIKFREGNRDEIDFQVDLHMAGAGLVVEGPIKKGKGSWLVSARRSYLDLLLDAIGIGVVPRYSDYQGKLSYSLSPSNKLSAIWIIGVDEVTFDSSEAYDQGYNVWGTYKGYEFATGLNWQWLWSKNGLSNTSISYLGTKYEALLLDAPTDNPFIRQNTLERTVHLRNVNNVCFSPSHSLEIGFDLKRFFNQNDVWIARTRNSVGHWIDELDIDERIEESKAGGFISYTARPISSLTTTIGLRYDYFAYNRRPHWSPRFSFSYQFTSSTSLNGAFGIYYQDLPLSLMAVSKNYRDLRDPKAHHYILGTSHLLAEDTRLTVEGYYKSYENLPLDMYQPQFSVIDWVVDYDSYSVLRNLTDAGEALSYGIETTLQKKLVRGLYGLVSGSYSRSRYKDLLGTWRNRLYDNRVLFSVEAGYKPNNRWEYSLRWVFAGGNPYTPLNLEASQFYNRTVLDSTRVNQERRPDYHSLNLRLDHHTYWKSASLVWYVSIWNVYNRKNVAFYYWDKSDRSEGVAHQWGILPIVGFELEF